DEQSASLETVETKIEKAEEELASIAEKAEAAFTQWIATEPAISVPDPIASFAFDDETAKSFANGVAEGEPAKNSPNNMQVEGKHGKAVKLTGDDAVTLPVGNFTRNEAFSISLWMQSAEAYERAVVFSRSKAWTDAASRGYELLIEDGKLSAALIHFYPGNALRVRSKEAFPVGEWKHVTITYDGSSRASGLKLYLDGREIETDVVRDKLTREITGGGVDTIVIGQRMRDNGFKNGLVDDFRIFDRELAPSHAALLAGITPVEPGKEDFFLTGHQPYLDQLAKLETLRTEQNELVKKIPEIMVMKETPEPHPTFLLDRGHYENKAEPVSADTPHFLPPMPEGAPKNRLGLAQWTVASDNPLTARVTVNRYWQMLFGTGLVSTSEDFGSQGRLPTHPELLDWLARRFVENGWDLQDLLKTIVLSATYRQSSNIASGELVERDPENTLLYRYPTTRLPAEAIRDNALAVSGLLVDKVGGPSVKPYDIEVSFKPSKPDKGEGLYRRSLYTYWKQTSPAPLMTTLNASKRDVCRVRLERTDSPLQGLVLLNSPQFVEASRVLAVSLIEKHGDKDTAIVEDAFRKLTSRAPDAEESKLLSQLLAEQGAHFAAAPEAATKLISVGDAAAGNPDNAPRVAAVTTLISTLMNFDETISRR
ncbi:MAG: DUF1553 domain-containing protein, partial [Verrucomicrobiota bacterium]